MRLRAVATEAGCLRGGSRAGIYVSLSLGLDAAAPKKKHCCPSIRKPGSEDKANAYCEGIQD